MRALQGTIVPVGTDLPATSSAQCRKVVQQLLCALDTYEAVLSTWEATPSFLDFSRVDAQLEKLRVLRVLVPPVAHEMAGIVTAHVDLRTMHIRDRTGAFGKQHSAAELAGARHRHSTEIEAMRRHCVQLLDDPAHPTQQPEN